MLKYMLCRLFASSLKPCHNCVWLHTETSNIFVNHPCVIRFDTTTSGMMIVTGQRNSIDGLLVHQFDASMKSITVYPAFTSLLKNSMVSNRALQDSVNVHPMSDMLFFPTSIHHDRYSDGKWMDYIQLIIWCGHCTSPRVGSHWNCNTFFWFLISFHIWQFHH